MDTDEMRRRSQSFGSVAQTYADHRPGYPGDAASWLVGDAPGRVLELGAGTGKLTTSLTALCRRVVATDPLDAMLQQLRQTAPAAAPVVCRAEDIPLPSSSVDVVVAAQAFHWFDKERALPEIARVLRPGGVLSLIWNVGDQSVPWVRRFMELTFVGGEDAGKDPVQDCELFAPSETQVFRHWQLLHRDSLVGFAASQSQVAIMNQRERDVLLDKVGALYDSYGRGPDGMLLPWRAYAYRARASGLANPGPEPSDDLDDGLLIDFD